MYKVFISRINVWKCVLIERRSQDKVHGLQTTFTVCVYQHRKLHKRMRQKRISNLLAAIKNCFTLDLEQVGDD